MKRLLVIGAALLLISCAHSTQSAAVKTPVAPAAAFPATQRQIIGAIDAGDGDVELQNLRARVIADPARLEARLELGQAYQKRGYPELALDHYRWAVEHSPESADAHLLLARSLDHAGRSAEAISLLASFLSAHPQKGPQLYSWLGILRDDVGDFKGSEQAYREALGKSTEAHDYLHNNLGYSLLRQGEHEQAVIEFRAALQLNPRSEIARDNLAVALAADSAVNSKEAILHWQSMNEPATAHSNLAAVLIEQGRYAEARKELEVALQYNQANPAALANFRLLSSLDGKAVTLPVITAPVTRWSRWKSTWRHWLDSGDVDGAGHSEAQGQVQTASQTKSESKQ